VSLEREVKLHVPPGFALPDLSAEDLSASVGEPRKVLAVYHDTEDLAIVRWGCSLRHREGEGWTVKLPASGDGEVLIRGEHVFPAVEGVVVPFAAAPRGRARPHSSRAAFRALPPSPSKSVESRRTSVDLPEPFWPRMATHSPRPIANVTPSRAGTRRRAKRPALRSLTSIRKMHSPRTSGPR